MSEYAIGLTAPPFHPWCRGTTAPYFDDMDDIAERWARDPETGETYTVPGNMTYKQWAAKQTGLAKSVKPLEKSTESGIVKSLDIDDFQIMASSKEIRHEVSDIIGKTIKEFEAKGGMHISAANFGDFYDEASGKSALFQVLPNQYGLVELNVNSRLLRGLTISEADAMIAKSKNNLPKSLKEAVIHECGHAKLIYGRSIKEVKKLYAELADVHIDGISLTAFEDGAECIAETEVLLYRNAEVPKKAKALYDKYTGGKTK